MEKSVNHSCLYLGHSWGDITTLYWQYGVFGMIPNTNYWVGQKCDNCEETKTVTHYNTENKE